MRITYIDLHDNVVPAACACACACACHPPLHTMRLRRIIVMVANSTIMLLWMPAIFVVCVNAYIFVHGHR